ncbi:hypothetical protein MHC_01355 [Mycoplasma haemocanis str. Illinois]|uniref:Uncharacterized protein n=1 Tax=Mycoplasma haemocanis (strain Illinois) TaxID=1111676 RepID=H6N665_MYCHN|nr:hypothetical protein [Mycoplasma haemocanis]AEW45137.1 hypothetical protein MHC_01355 [Mycoplasma haemocanis str. Illinois]
MLGNKAILGLVGGVITASVGVAVKAGDIFGGNHETIRILLLTHQPKKRLLLKGYKGVQDGSPQEWKDAWKQYRVDYQNVEDDPFGLLKTKPVSVAEENATDGFMSACSSIFDEKVSGIKSEMYKLADKYCTRFASVSDLVWESNYQVLQKGSDGNSQDWKNLWKKYREDNRDREPKQDEWKLSNEKWTGAIDANAEAPNEFRTKCEQESQIKNVDKNNSSYLMVLKYCSISQQK